MIESSKKSRVMVGFFLISSIVFWASSEGAPAASSARRTILMTRIGVAFDIPRGFIVFQWEDHEGSYTTGLRFGKEFRPGHFKFVPFELGFGRSHVDCSQIQSNKPSSCVDAEYRRVKENVRNRVPGYELNPEYITLFGNKAVRSTHYNPNRYTVIIGYLSVSQLPEPLSRAGNEYLARIEFTQDIPSTEFDREYKMLIDTVINSLRVIR